MRRVAILAPPGPAAGLAPAAWRAGQLARLYRQLGRPVDLVLCGAASDADLLVAWRLFDRVALAGPEGPDAAFLARFAETQGLAAVHALVAPPGDVPAALIRDLACAGPEAPVPEVGGAALVVASTDAALGPHLEAGRGLRLPWVAPPRQGPALPRPPGGPLGWAGPGGPGLAAAWSALLATLWRRLGGWPAGVLLAGHWAEAVVVPPAMAGVRRLAAPADPLAALRALGLAALPAAIGPAGDLVVTAALRYGVPVLAVDDAARGFDDRWPLPRPAGAEAMGHLLVDEGLAVAAPEAAIARAAAEMDRDGAAMEAHALSRIGALLSA